MKQLLVSAILLWAGFAPAHAQPAAVPLDPIVTILDAFRTHDIVALGEGSHNNEQGAAFRLTLIRDPRFAATVNDIVVESGNSLYQNVMDRFVLRGEDVPLKELRQVWQNTTQPGTTWDKPIHEEFFRAVRDVNSALPAERRIRVLLGDPPVDWSRVTKWDDIPMADRDSVPAQIIAREVLAKKRRALVIYGDGHFRRKNVYWAFKDPAQAQALFDTPVNTLVPLLERQGAEVFSIWTSTQDMTRLQADIAKWQAPAVAVLRGTSLGMTSYAAFYPEKAHMLVNGVAEHVGPDPVRSPLMQDQFDAILYIGPATSITYSKLSAELCADRDYLVMRASRMALFGPPPAPSAAGATPRPSPVEAECQRAAQSR